MAEIASTGRPGVSERRHGCSINCGMRGEQHVWPVFHKRVVDTNYLVVHSFRNGLLLLSCAKKSGIARQSRKDRLNGWLERKRIHVRRQLSHRDRSSHTDQSTSRCQDQRSLDLFLLMSYRRYSLIVMAAFIFVGPTAAVGVHLGFGTFA